MTRDAFRFLTGLAGAVLAVMGALMLLPTPDSGAADQGSRSADPRAEVDAEGHFAVTHVRLFDGESVLDDATVIVRDGVVEAVGPADDVAVPEGAAEVSGAGRTLLPGLVDSHVHAFGDALRQSAVFGVTTVFDQFTDPEFVRRMRSERAEAQDAAQDGDGAPIRADLYSAGILATKAGGHGTQFGLQIPTFDVDPQSVTREELYEAARDFVAARVDEGSDWIKIVYDDLGDPSGGDAGSRPHLARTSVAALIRAAHDAGRQAVVHVSEREAAREVLEDGADGLVHLWVDEPVDDALVALAKERGAFVIPTLTVLESVSGTAGGATLASDERLAKFLPAAAKARLRTPFDVEPDPSRLEVALSATRALHEAGVPILAGTDAPNPGTAYGVSMLRELELLVRAGLTPTEALRAATSEPFAAFGLGETRGRIVVGAPADLLLLPGDPTSDGKPEGTSDGTFDGRALRESLADVVAVWKRGRLVPREAVAEAASSSSLGPGVIGSFDDVEDRSLSGEQDILPADQGFGWTATTDERMGGTSTVTLRVRNSTENSAEDDTEGGVLVIEGEIREGFAYPWAGAIYFPGTRPMEPTDLSAAPELVFRARGEGSFRLMLFAPSVGQIPAQRGFDVTDHWTEVQIDLRKLGGELKDVTALSIAAGGPPGPFRLEVDDVTLR